MENQEIGTFGDYVPNTHPVLANLNAKVTTLTEENETLKTREQYLGEQLRKSADKYRSAEYSLTDVLKSLLDDEEISMENAQRIADIFDNVNLTKRISIRYQVTVGVELEVPYGADEDDVADQTYCDRVTFDTYNSDYEVLECDFEVEDWNVVS
jgi:hypothetical protein